MAAVTVHGRTRCQGQHFGRVKVGYVDDFAQLHAILGRRLEHHGAGLLGLPFDGYFGMKAGAARRHHGIDQVRQGKSGIVRPRHEQPDQSGQDRRRDEVTRHGTFHDISPNKKDSPPGSNVIYAYRRVGRRCGQDIFERRQCLRTQGSLMFRPRGIIGGQLTQVALEFRFLFVVHVHG